MKTLVPAATAAAGLAAGLLLGSGILHAQQSQTGVGRHFDRSEERGASSTRRRALISRTCSRRAARPMYVILEVRMDTGMRRPPVPRLKPSMSPSTNCSG